MCGPVTVMVQTDTHESFSRVNLTNSWRNICCRDVSAYRNDVLLHKMYTTGENKTMVMARDFSNSDNRWVDKGGTDKSGRPINIYGTYEDRSTCPYWHQFGCLMDQVELLCTFGDPEIMNMLQEEGTWMCCCPYPYQNCALRDRIVECDAAMARHILPLLTKGEKDIPTIMTAVQSVRKDLWSQNENCQKYTAKPEPFAKCGDFHLPDKNTGSDGEKSNRPDLFCEMLTWQLEHMGDGNDSEFIKYNCPVISNEYRGVHVEGEKISLSRTPSKEQVPSHDLCIDAGGKLSFKRIFA